MDQYVSSAARSGGALLIDCRSLEYEWVAMMGHRPTTSDGADRDHDHRNHPNNISSDVTFLVCNSNVQHSIGGGEYPVRVQQCRDATDILQRCVSHDIQTLRDATPAHVEAARPHLTDVLYRRAKHVVTENDRTLRAKQALTTGDWDTLGRLMNESHTSMKRDYQVSCDEIDYLVETLSQTFQGVYGSRLTGGGFGGCTVTLVQRDRAQALTEHLIKEYQAKEWTDGTKKECVCFETSPGPGARAYVLS